MRGNGRDPEPIYGAVLIFIAVSSVGLMLLSEWEAKSGFMRGLSVFSTIVLGLQIAASIYRDRIAK